ESTPRLRLAVNEADLHIPGALRATGKSTASRTWPLAPVPRAWQVSSRPDTIFSMPHRIAVTDWSVSPRFPPARGALPRTASGSQSGAGEWIFARHHEAARDLATLLARSLRWGVTEHPKQRPREQPERGGFARARERPPAPWDWLAHSAPFSPGGGPMRKRR